MTQGVLLYCFNTPEVNYHKLAERCVKQIKKYLRLPITIVTDIDTFKKFAPMGMIDYKITDPATTNTRSYRGKNIKWYNRERVLAYEHSPYDKTILMDCDYFVFSDFLLTLLNTDFDIMLHNNVHDVGGNDLIKGADEGTLPLVWATVTLFSKTDKTKIFFDLLKTVQQNYLHYMNLYRIKYPNYRNDFAFAIALHQLRLGNMIPSPMTMLGQDAKILENDDTGLIFSEQGKVGYINGQDVHVMDKEWCND